MGYTILEGAELEDDWHNFEALNMSAGTSGARHAGHALPRPRRPHRDRERPARLLTHAYVAACRIRYMESHQPPVRIIAPGRVYRRDNSTPRTRRCSRRSKAWSSTKHQPRRL
jgi:phenylalanyl-tRNA synthetase alpha chain